MKAILLFAISATILAGSPADAAVKSTGKKLPTKLPKVVKKKKTKINFEENSGTHTTTVIVRTPLPLEEALQDRNRAAQNVKVISSAISESGLTSETADQLPPIAQEEKPLRYHVVPPLEDAPPARRVFVDETKLLTAESASEADHTAKPENALSEILEAGPPPQITTPVHESISQEIATSSPNAPTPQTESSTEPPATSTGAQASLTTNVSLRESSARVNRFHLRSAFLNARYSEIDPQLENGARSLAIGWSRDRQTLEGRLSLELGYGHGQDIAVQNTRYVIARADALYFFRPRAFRPFVGFGLGLGDFNVRVQRLTDEPHQLVYREYAKGSAVVASPSTGVRFDIGDFALDFSAEYLAVIGAGATSSLGGWAGALGFSFPF